MNKKYRDFVLYAAPLAVASVVDVLLDTSVPDSKADFIGNYFFESLFLAGIFSLFSIFWFLRRYRFRFAPLVLVALALVVQFRFWKTCATMLIWGTMGFAP